MKVERVNKIWFIVLSMIAAFPLLPKGIESSLMIVFFIISIYLWFKENKKVINKERLKTVAILSSVFIIYSISSFYSVNLKESLKFILITSPILMFPLSIGLLADKKISNKEFLIIKRIYVFSTFLSLAITHIYLNNNALNDVTNWEYRNMFEDYTKVHGTYFSLWIGFAIIIILDEILKKGINIIILLVSLFMIFYFFYWQYIIGARLPLFMTLLLSVLYFVLKLEKKSKIIASIILIFSTIFFISIKKNTIKDKLKFGMPEGKYELKHLEMTSEEIRTGIYFCSLNLIKESWLIGYGIGDVNDNLNKCYLEKIKSNVYQKFHYNSHNQFLQIFLTSGVLGLIYFVFNLFYVVKILFKNKQQLYLYFNILVIICFFTENILSRHDGVLFYSYFSTILFFKLKK